MFLTKKTEKYIKDKQQLNTSDYKMIELGGNIKLDGFDGVQPAQLIVIKKIVGNFTKQYSEKVEVKELLVSLKDEKKNKISVKLNEDVNESDEGDNLFFVLDGLLVKIKDKLG